MNSKIIKALKIGAVGALLLGATAGCIHTDSTVKELEKTAYEDGVNSVVIPDITSDNEAVRQLALEAGKASVDITSDNDIAINEAIQAKIAQGLLKINIPEGLGFVKDSLVFGTPYSFIVKHKDLDRLDKSKIEFEDEDYNTWEEITISPTIAFDEPKFEGVSALSFLKGGVSYMRYLDMDTSLITVDDSVKLKLWDGKDAEIIKWEADKVTVLTGAEYDMKIGESQPVGDNSILKVVKIGENSARVSVDGTERSVALGDIVTINKIEVKLTEIFWEEAIAERSVLVETGKDLKVTYTNGEAIDDDSIYNYVVTSTGVGITTNVKYNYYETNDDHYGVVYEGEKLVFPFASIAYNLEDNYAYYGVSLEKDNIDETNGIMALGSFDFDGDNYNKVFCNGINLEVKKDGEWITADTVTIDDTESTLFAEDGVCGITDGVATDLEMSGVFVGDKDLQDTDHTIVLGNGIKVLDVKDNFENEEIKASVPEEIVKGKITIN